MQSHAQKKRNAKGGASKRKAATQTKRGGRKRSIPHEATEETIRRDLVATVDERMRKYAQTATISAWSDAKNLEQTRGVVLDNEIRTREVARQLGQYYSADEVAEWVKKYVAIIDAFIDAIFDCARRTSGMPPRVRTQLLDELRAIRAEYTTKLKTAAGD